MRAARFCKIRRLCQWKWKTSLKKFKSKCQKRNLAKQLAYGVFSWRCDRRENEFAV